MRSEDEDEEEDFEEENDENEEDEDEGYGQQPNGGPDGGDDEAMGYFDEDASGEENDEDDAEGDVDVDADGDADEGEGDDDEDDDESGDGEGDADEDEDEDDDGDGDEDDEEDGHSEDEDVEMADGDQGSVSSHPSQRTAGKTVDLPLPPHLVRRSLFTPAFTTPPSTLTIEAIVAIPLPTAIHSIAASACSSYLLTGGQDGYIRAYDFWASVNGSQLMTAQQRTSVGLGEGVNKAGVGRGWWPNEVEGMNGGTVSQRREAVYSMAVEGDALWSLSGTQSGPINLYTLRHSPGHLVHTLKGHSNVVSCMSLLPNEKGLLSGSWDGTVKEWDLNTGQTVRTYPTHGAQISSLSLRPFSHPVSPTPSPQPIDEDEDKGTKLDVSVNVGSDFFQKDRKDGSAVSPTKDTSAMEIDGNTDSKGEAQDTKPIPEGTDADADGSDKASPFDPLFDDDAEGESVLPSGEVTMTGTPAINDMAPPSPPRPAPSLVLPGMTTNGNTPVANGAQTSSVPSTPLFSIPSQAGPSRLGAASTIPLLSPASWKTYSEDVMLNSSMDGQVLLIDRRIPDNGSNTGVGRLKPGDKAPPWCMSATWSGDGNQVLAGRRNGTIDVWDIRRSSSSTAPNLLRVLRTPTESGPVSCIVSMPDGRHVATASQDNIRLWNTYEYFHDDKFAAGGEGMKKRGGLPPFKIIAGHHGGIVSSMLVDPAGGFLVAASGDRGWQGESTKVVLVHEIKW